MIVQIASGSNASGKYMTTTPLEPDEFGWCYHAKPVGNDSPDDKNANIGYEYTCSKHKPSE